MVVHLRLGEEEYCTGSWDTGRLTGIHSECYIALQHLFPAQLFINASSFLFSVTVCDCRDGQAFYTLCGVNKIVAEG
jgi:hypothetical protein